MNLDPDPNDKILDKHLKETVKWILRLMGQCQKDCEREGAIFTNDVDEAKWRTSSGQFHRSQSATFDTLTPDVWNNMVREFHEKGIFKDSQGNPIDFIKPEPPTGETHHE
jgi:hypothetical protein